MSKEIATTSKNEISTGKEKAFVTVLFERMKEEFLSENEGMGLDFVHMTNWLSTDKKTRYEDKGDRCRIGYVAFSRAKQVLCIASKKKISIELKKKIEDLGVQII